MAGKKTPATSSKPKPTKRASASNEPTKRASATKAPSKRESATKEPTQRASATKEPSKRSAASPKPPKPKATKATKLPPALAERAAQMSQAKQARLAAEARADIALIVRRQARITEDFYDIGEALARLKRPGVAAALGRTSFRQVCEADLKMSIATADRLIAIVTQIPRHEAQRMGQQRALALIDLAKATPEPDTPATLETATRTLPSGKKLHVTRASAREIQRAATEVRRARTEKGAPRGKRVTSDERARADELQTALRAGGLPRARLTAVATKPGQPADLRIEGVPLTERKTLGRLLAK